MVVDGATLRIEVPTGDTLESEGDFLVIPPSGEVLTALRARVVGPPRPATSVSATTPSG